MYRGLHIGPIHMPGNILLDLQSIEHQLTLHQRTSPNSTIATTIYTSASSIEYTTRVAKIVARRTKKPVYVGCSIDPNALGMSVEEEMEGLKKIVEVIVGKYEAQKNQ